MDAETAAEVVSGARERYESRVIKRVVCATLYDRSVTLAESRVLLHIAVRAPDGRAQLLTRGQLAEDLGLSIGGVRNALARLRGRGWLSMTNHRSQGNQIGLARRWLD